jgi:hypothetical protein
MELEGSHYPPLVRKSNITHISNTSEIEFIIPYEQYKLDGRENLRWNQTLASRRILLCGNKKTTEK